MPRASLRDTSPASCRPLAELLLTLKWLHRFGWSGAPEDRSHTLSAAALVGQVCAVLNDTLPEDSWNLGFET